jgi:hypothetical protein
MLSNLEVDYTINKTTLHAGRGQVNLDNQRFIGTVGWRQLERSYDTLYVADNSVEGLNLLGAFVYGFEGVGGTATTDTSSVLLHASYKVMDELTVTAYDYMLATGTYGSDTYGLALTGNINLDAAKLNYRAEYAMQSDATMDYSDYEGKADADYMNFDLGANISGVLLGANYELLSAGNDGQPDFNPALGTNHKFNGWADVFYVGNGGTGNGLQDLNGRIGYKAKGFGKVLAVYHKFDSDVESKDFGSEIDVLYANKIPGVNGLNGLVKAAFYSAGDTNTGHTNADQDKTVVCVQADYKF